MTTHTVAGIQRSSVIVAVIGLVLTAALVVNGSLAALYQSYLTMYLFCFGVAIGCLGIGLLYTLTGGAWGRLSLPILQSAADTIPWLALLFVPIAIGLPSIYPWANPAAMAGDALSHERLYFSLPFFLGRAVFYFALWTWMAARLRRPTGYNAFAMLLYVFSVSFATFDWMMSLEFLWSSAIYGLMVTSGFWLSAFAFIVVIHGWRERRGVLPALPVQPCHDLGNLILAFVMIWTYTMLSQHLIMWNGNLPDEIRWYLIRNRGGWKVVTVMLLVIGFAIPFTALLSRRLKQRLSTLTPVASLLLVTAFYNVFWLTVPEWSPSHASFSISNAAMILVVGGAWFAYYCARLKRLEVE